MAYPDVAAGARSVRWLQWWLQESGAARDRTGAGPEVADCGATEIANYETVAGG